MKDEEMKITGIDEDVREAEVEAVEGDLPPADIDNPPWEDRPDHPPASAVMTVDPIFALAEKGVAIDQLERLIAMRERQEEREAKKGFELHFAEMQAEFTPVKRSKKGDKSSYAPIEEMQRQYGAIIARHGFSYRFPEKELEDGKLEVTLVISGYEHSETNSKILPAYEPDKGGQSGKSIMNPLQAEGTRSTYGQRYAFIAGFGITMEDMDTDGALTFEMGAAYPEYINAILAEKTLEGLRETSKRFHDELKAKKDYDGAQAMLSLYNREKRKYKGVE